MILCADNDGAYACTNAVIEHTQSHFKIQDKEITVIRPKNEGHEFNDVLKEKGVQAIKAFVGQKSQKTSSHQEIPHSFAHKKHYQMER